MGNFIKINRIYILIGCFLVFVNSSLFWFNKTDVPQEFFYYIWLVGKGHIIYKDFFHNHGPLIYYLLAPFSSDTSLTWFKIFYTLVQSANLVLVLILIKKFSGILGFIIGGITFIVLNFYFSYNYFWDEQIIATIFLLIYYLINSKEFRLQTVCIGILIGLASLIKLNALIIVIPVLVLYKKKSFLFYPILIWSIILMYFFLQNYSLQFIDNYIVFNLHYQNYALKYYPYLSALKSNWHFLNIHFLIVIFIFAIHSLNKKNINGKLLVFLLISTSFMYPIIAEDRLAPFASFLAIFISYLFTITNKKFIFIIIMLLYLMSYSFEAKNKVETFQTRPAVIENTRSKKIITYFKNKNLYSKNFYIMSNNVEIYYLLNKPYKVYHPEMFPVISGYYKDFQETYIKDIKRNKTDLIVIPLPIDVNYELASNLITFIKTNYSLSYKDSDFLVYTVKIK